MTDEGSTAKYFRSADGSPSASGMRRTFTACAAPFESRAEETDEVETTPPVHIGSVQTLEGMTGESAAA